MPSAFHKVPEHRSSRGGDSLEFAVTREETRISGSSFPPVVWVVACVTIGRGTSDYYLCLPIPAIVVQQERCSPSTVEICSRPSSCFGSQRSADHIMWSVPGRTCLARRRAATYKTKGLPYPDQRYSIHHARNHITPLSEKDVLQSRCLKYQRKESTRSVALSSHCAPSVSPFASMRANDNSFQSSLTISLRPSVL